jgi:hypothetical protein
MRINKIHEQFVTLGRKLERISEDEAGLAFFVLVADPGIGTKKENAPYGQNPVARN